MHMCAQCLVGLNYAYLTQITGKCGSCIKTVFFYIFSPIFSTQIKVFLPFEGRNMAYQCKGLDQSNIVCEYEVNLSANEKVVTEQTNFNTNS